MQRLKELDILRGFASLNVVIYHYTSRYRDIFHHDYPIKYDWYFGHVGLELFFIISGFVIFMTLQKVNSVQEFSFKRLTRLYPAYWICICITLLISSFWKMPRSEDLSVFQILMNFTMIQGVFEVPNIDGAYWSLVPELFFYTSMGILFYLGWLKNIRLIAVIWLSWMLFNKLGILSIGEYFLNLKYGMFLLAGILFYKIKYNNGNLIDHLLILCCLFTAIWVNRMPYNIIAYPFLFSLFYLFIYGKLKVLNWSPLLFLGYISYPLYLLHQNIGYAMISTFKFYIRNDFIAILLTLSIMFFFAWIVKKYLEKPIITYLNTKYLPRFKLKTESIIEPPIEILVPNKYS
jgi:peptidoglycan/LPS O-acetylase OafA/YrhL